MCHVPNPTLIPFISFSTCTIVQPLRRLRRHLPELRGGCSGSLTVSTLTGISASPVQNPHIYSAAIRPPPSRTPLPAPRSPFFLQYAHSPYILIAASAAIPSREPRLPPTFPIIPDSKVNRSYSFISTIGPISPRFPIFPQHKTPPEGAGFSISKGMIISLLYGR